MNVSDVTSIDEHLKQTLTGDKLKKYNELCQDLVQKYSLYPRKIHFLKKLKDPIKEKIVCDYITRASLFANTSLKNNMLEYLANAKKQEQNNRCLECHSDNFQQDDDSGNLVCLFCGLEKPDMSYIAYHDIENTTLSRTPIYQRSKHFRELVMKYQGKITRSIEPEVIEQLKKCFRRNEINPRKATLKNICRFLLETGHPKYYEFSNYIYSVMTGAFLPQLSDTEEQLFRDFDELQKAFNELPKEEKNRNNFLKNDRVLLCLLKKYNIPFDSDAFPDLIDEQREKSYDQILQQLFKKLNW